MVMAVATTLVATTIAATAIFVAHRRRRRLLGLRHLVGAREEIGEVAGDLDRV